MKSFAPFILVPAFFTAFLFSAPTVYAQAKVTPPASNVGTAVTTGPTSTVGEVKPVSVTPKTKQVEVTPIDTDAAINTGKLLFTTQENLMLQAELIRTKADSEMKPLIVAYNRIDALVDEWVNTVKTANKWGDNVTFNKKDHKFYKTVNVDAPPQGEPEAPAPVTPAASHHGRQ